MAGLSSSTSGWRLGLNQQELREKTDGLLWLWHSHSLEEMNGFWELLIHFLRLAANILLDFRTRSLEKVIPCNVSELYLTLESLKPLKTPDPAPKAVTRSENQDERIEAAVLTNNLIAWICSREATWLPNAKVPTRKLPYLGLNNCRFLE